MECKKISPFLALSLLAAPFVLSSSPPPRFETKPTEVEFSSLNTANRRMKHLLGNAPVLQPVQKPMGTAVGELQEKWQFPSDHIPIGMTFRGHHFASWNVLENEAMDWVIDKNSQGLKESLIAKEYVFIEGTELTIRDLHIIDLIMEMIEHPSHPRSVLALQEANEPFLAELRSRFAIGGKNFDVIADHGNAIVVDRSRFDLVEAKAVSGVYSEKLKRSFQDLTLQEKETQESIRILNTHIPGNPEKPARYEFVQYIKDTYNPAIHTIAMGDMNFNEVEMGDALEKSFGANDRSFTLYAPYCTNITPTTFVSKCIDHFIVHSPDEVTINQPEEVMTGLVNTLDLLYGRDGSPFHEVHAADDKVVSIWPEFSPPPLNPAMRRDLDAAVSR